MNIMHIKITEKMHLELKGHLHCGDGFEAVAFALCGRHQLRDETFLFIHKFYLIPYGKCIRSENRVSWNTEDVTELLEEASKKGMGIIKFHSHFVDETDFSILDDESDKSFFDTVYAWTQTELPHASVIMYPNGNFRGRVISPSLEFIEVNQFSIIGNKFSSPKALDNADVNLAFKRNTQAFGMKTNQLLGNMKIGIVGCSGTGSPLIEQLVRLGVGEIVIVDNDRLGVENLNRIVGSTYKDAKDSRLKVDVIKDHIERIGLETKVFAFADLIQESREAVNELVSCDFLFGCMDSVEGRHYLNLLSTYYLLPYIDIGIKLVADGTGGIDSIIGNIHYIYPNSETLLERKVFTMHQLEAESLKRVSPLEYQKRQRYFENEEVENPAVISVNSVCSSLAVNELLARIHPYRFIENNEACQTVVNLCNWDIANYGVECTRDKIHSDNIGVGNLETNLIIDS